MSGVHGARYTIILVVSYHIQSLEGTLEVIMWKKSDIITMENNPSYQCTCNFITAPIITFDRELVLFYPLFIHSVS